MAWLTWQAAMSEALYGPNGFYRRPEGPAGHFRTSVHATPYFAAAVLELARTAGLSTIVDVGSGRGELVRRLRWLDADIGLHGVDLAARPPDLPDDIDWSDEIPQCEQALVFANEWLDAIPVDVVEQTPDGPCLVEVDTVTGEERLGEAVSAEDVAWLARWWPLDDETGSRAEVGLPRDAAWASAVSRVGSGVAVAVDYGHEASSRPPGDTVVGYREGRVVPAVPDGSCDISIHVAIDSCAAAGETSGATTTLLTRQRPALRAIGIRGARPPLELASTDPPRYLRELQAAGQQAELIDGAGLGRFHWLVQTVGVALPPPLRDIDSPA